ncbi:MAG: hypothetical protein M3Z33_00135, partial [Actinomycetota bacterium]|nr:hypothetical protein [Actinomycetota bacterium]
PKPGRRRRRAAPVLAALALVAAVLAGLVIAAGGSDRNGSGRTTASPAPSGAPAPAKAPAAPGPASPTTPAGAVEGFYQRAASHLYPEAWALAGPGVRAQLGGFDAFQGQFQTLRSITFSRAQATSQTADRATVAIATTAVHTTRTDRCTGSVELIRSGGGWSLEHIGVSC